jgi:hypothetical protein
LLDGEHGDGIAQVGVCLVAHLPGKGQRLRRRALPARFLSGGRRSGAQSAYRVSACTYRLTTVGRAPRDRGETHDLLIAELEVAGMRQQKTGDVERRRAPGRTTRATHWRLVRLTIECAARRTAHSCCVPLLRVHRGCYRERTRESESCGES